MAFLVEDFRDLLRLLDDHPEWRADLRARLLTEELLQLPALVRDLAEAQARTEQRLEALAEAQARTELRLEALAEAQARTEQRLEALAEAQARTEQRLEALAAAQARTEQRLEALAESMQALAERVDALAERVQALAVQVGQLASQVGQIVAQLSELNGKVGDHAGRLLEMDYARKGPAFFARVARRLRLVDFGALAARLEDAREDGTITQEEEDEVMSTDIVLEGRRRTDGMGEEVYLLVEVSWGIGSGDIQRATDRSSILAKLGKPAIPVVAGKWMDLGLVPMADGLRVWRVLNGSTVSPPDGRAGTA